MKLFFVVLLSFIAMGGYIQYVFHSKEIELKEIAKQFNAACQQAQGCILQPEGWEGADAFYYKDRFQYSASPEKFILNYHIATDTWLQATGGKNQQLVILDIGEHSSFQK